MEDLMDAEQRVTHGHEGELAVFLIGMRVNRWWRIDQWLPAAASMPRMLKELYAEKAAAERGKGEHPGFLGHRLLIGGAGITVVQYWRTVEDIYAYAASADHEHRPAWAAFNARARRSPGVVGIWHETFAVPAGGHESIYVSMPPTGLAAATTVVPVARRGETARERIAS
jgi:heme-degrading monooxygenase HmoA